MNKLNYFILLSLCLSVCFSSKCARYYTGIDEITGQTIAKGLISDFIESDHGEASQSGRFQSNITLLDNGLYEVQGSYKTSVEVSIQDPHLCVEIYYGHDETRGDVFYQFTRQRDPSRIGQEFTQEEVTPDFNEVRGNLIQGIADFASASESDYIIEQIEDLAIMSVQRFKQY